MVLLAHSLKDNMTALHVLKIVGILFAGGVLTSIAESLFHYSLYDTLKDKILSLFHKKSAQ